VSVSGLTLINGSATDAFGRGGAIFANANLTLSDVVIDNSQSVGAGGGVAVLFGTHNARLHRQKQPGQR
jgi:predicted outer membrane repeat protein